ncbi:hypothetical protein FRC01_007704 [Tulasnella sp. 417]|nr:hypothetical protein FRC01_007704 [Tulasnella sp. 417]
MSRSSAAAAHRSGSPPAPVLVWDSKTESFTPRVPDPHSSISSIHCIAPSSPTSSARQSSSYAVNSDVNPQHRFPPSSASPPSPLRTSHPNDSTTGTIGTKKTRRMRHHSNPESIVDFGEFLRQIERERTVSAGAGQAENVVVPDASTPSAKPLPPPPSALSPPNPKTFVKNPLKSVLKEVLGGGGNNQSLIVPKDSVVPSFGRGGIARTNTKSSKSSKESGRNKKDPYYAHIPFGSPPSPTQMYFPPNSNLPFPRAKQVVDPWAPVSMQADISYFVKKPKVTAQEYAEQVGRARAAAVSPAPTTSSVSTASSDGPHDSFGKGPEGRQAGLAITTAVDHNKPPKRRSKSFSSPVSPDAALVTPPPKTGPSIGVFLHPAQAALEARLMHQAEEAKEKSKDGVRVVVQPVDDHSARDVDVISMVDTEADDLISLSGFPLPPSTPAGAARDRLFSLPVTPTSIPAEPKGRQHSASGSLQPPPRMMGPRPQTRNTLPTMPAPSQAFRQPQVTLPSSDISSWIPPLPSRAPPPVKIPSTPVSPARSKPLGPPPSIPLPPIPTSSSPPIFGSAPGMARRGSLPERAASSPPSSLPKNYGQSFPDHLSHRPHQPPQSSQQPWLPHIHTDIRLSPDMAPMFTQGVSPVSELPPSVPDQDYLQQLALERERQELEERVRGLMWLVTSLEQESQTGHDDVDRVDRALTPRGTGTGLRTPSPATTDKRSSTSTERAVTYLPYAR